MDHLHDQLLQELELRGYSAHTCTSYVRCVLAFVSHFERPPQELGTKHIRSYLHYLVRERQLSQGAINQAYSALKILYQAVLGLPWDSLHLPRSKKPKQLPVVLSSDELERLFAAISYLKHRALLVTLYWAGLRVSEVTHLKVSAIDSSRMLIRVRQGKGRKDRYTLLAERPLPLLRAYWRKHHPRDWLFPGLKELARDPQHLGADIGCLALLHTWTQTLTYHPHLHCIVTGGGLAPDGKKWIPARSDFFLPIKVVARLFLSNDRIIRVEEEQVTFRYRDRKDHDRLKTMTLSAFEFIRRFLLHILPHRFVRIRYYGLLSHRGRHTQLKQARGLLGVKAAPPTAKESSTWQERLQRLTGLDVQTCPQCRKGKMVTHKVLWPQCQRDPPLVYRRRA